MRKILLLTCIFFLIGGSIKAYANNVSEKSFSASPKDISLTHTIDNLNINFDINTLPDDIEIVSINIDFFQKNNTNGNAILELINPQDNAILGAVSIMNAGNKQFLGLKTVFSSMITSSKYITYKLKAENLGDSESLILENITLNIKYKIVDKIAPKIKNIEIIEITEDSAFITWITDEATKSAIRYGKTSNYTNTIESTTPDNITYATEHSALILNLFHGITYHFQIVAEDEVGNITESDDKSFLTEISIKKEQILGNSKTVLKKIQGLTGLLYYEDGIFKLQIIWQSSENTDIDGYYLYRQEENGQLQLFKTLPSDQTQFIDEGLTEFLSYTYTIRAYQGINISPQSDKFIIRATQDNCSNKYKENEYIDFSRIILFVSIITVGLMAVGYFFAKHINKFIKNTFKIKKRKNLFRDPEFMKGEFEKNNID